jgi:hypothetical protein
MATPTRTRQRHAPVLEDLDAGGLVVRDANAPLERLRKQSMSGEWATPARGQLLKAVAGWMGLTFLVSYVVLPAIAAAAGISLNLVPLFDNLQAFLVTTMVTLGVIGMIRPSVRVPRQRKADSGPEVAATAGSLLVWAAAHQLLWVLEPLHAMPAVELLPFVLMNLVEHSLFGVMLASFTRSAPKAFGLGVLFQLLFLGMTLFFFG